MSSHYEAELEHISSGNIVRVRFTSEDDLTAMSGFSGGFPFDVNWSSIRDSLFRSDSSVFTYQTVEVHSD